MSHRYDVDPDSLGETARKIEREAGESKAALGQASESVTGHSGLSAAITEFVSRWTKAHGLAREETQLVADTLRKTADLYRSGDHEANQNFGGYER